jgi:hypothetical protein
MMFPEHLIIQLNLELSRADALIAIIVLEE